MLKSKKKNSSKHRAKRLFNNKRVNVSSMMWARFRSAYTQLGLNRFRQRGTELAQQSLEMGKEKMQQAADKAREASSNAAKRSKEMLKEAATKTVELSKKTATKAAVRANEAVSAAARQTSKAMKDAAVSTSQSAKDYSTRKLVAAKQAVVEKVRFTGSSLWWWSLTAVAVFGLTLSIPREIRIAIESRRKQNESSNED